MLVDLSKKKSSSLVWLFLCITIFLSCILSPSLFPTESSFTGSHSSSLQGDRTTETGYPDFIHELFTRGQTPFLLSHSGSPQRIPLRLPIPHVWISYVLLLFSGLWIFHKERLKNRNENGNFRNYIIRYIHNQDGETYRSFFLI